MLGDKFDSYNHEFHSQKRFFSTSLVHLGLILLTVFSSHSSLAQVIPDNSLGEESSVVIPNATIGNELTDLIEGGAIRGNNLFHSFEQFSIVEGGRVYFSNPKDISSILTRVTGNSASEIFGTLGVNGGANLFLLNPNGIIFGKNAALNIGGSFFATTAESYLLDDTTEFSATNPEIPPLLTVNLNLGLQLGTNPGRITIRGSGHELTGGVFFPVQNNNPASDFSINSGQTFGLIGGEIEFDGGVIQTTGGNIELASVRQGEVKLALDSTNKKVSTSQVTEFGDLRLRNRSLLNTSGRTTGDISLVGSTISLEEASLALIQNFGTHASGTITVNAAESINLSGAVRIAPDIATPQGPIRGVAASRLMTEALADGRGGDIEITGRNLTLSDSSFITSRSFSNANTGNLGIDVAESIQISGLSVLAQDIPAIIGTGIFSNGNSGTIDLAARNVSLMNGGTISSLNFGSGTGGDIRIEVAENLSLSGISFTNTPSTIASTVNREGDSSNVTINTNTLSIQDGSRVSTGTFAEGNAGTLIINANSYVEIRGATPDGSLNSAIASDGIVLTPALQQLLGTPDAPSGDSGNVTISTPELLVKDGASVAVSNQGSGNSGQLEISSDRIFLTDNASITAFSTSGQGGNIDLKVEDQLSLENNSSITTETTANSVNSLENINGGNITIKASVINLLNSQINAQANQGNGGNIEIVTKGLFADSASRISASSQFGVDGNVRVETISGERPLELTQLPQTPINATEVISQGCNLSDDFVVLNRGGIPDNPLKLLKNLVLWQDLRLPENDLVQNSGLENSSENMSLSITPGSKNITEATNWQVNSEGVLELVAHSNHGNPISQYSQC